MSRPLRLLGPGLLYHVMARGNAKMRIFEDALDHERFLEILGGVAERDAVAVVAYCLMPNHYHLVARTRDANLPSAMAHLNGHYAQWWNRTHGRVGHLFQGRYKAQVVQQRRYLVAVCRYVLRNPVRARLANHPADWRWSSYAATTDVTAAPSWLDPHTLLDELGESDTAAAFEHFVTSEAGEAGGGNVADAIRGDQRVIGDSTYVLKFGRRSRAASPEIPRRDRFQGRPPLERLLRGSPQRALLAERIRAARRVHGYSVPDIATHLGVGTASVWRMLRLPSR